MKQYSIALGLLICVSLSAADSSLEPFVTCHKTENGPVFYLEENRRSGMPYEHHCSECNRLPEFEIVKEQCRACCGKLQSTTKSPSPTSEYFIDLTVI